MRIGIDARFLTHPQPGGFKTHTENLVDALGQVDRVNKYVVYLDRSPSAADLPQKDNFTYRVVSGAVPAVGLPVREQIRLRRQVRRDSLDIVHFLCNTASVGLAGKFVLTLHDTIQVTARSSFNLFRSLRNHKRWAMTAYSKWTILGSAPVAQTIITVSNW